MSNPLQQYSLFVSGKTAPPRTLSEDEFDWIHAALGIATEILELQQSTHRENTKEELGDLLFYLTFASNFHMISKEDLLGLWENTTWDTHSNTLPQEDLGVAAEAYLSGVKKRIIYRNPVLLNTEFAQLFNAFCIMLKACNVDLLELIEENKEKLNKRYKKTFTTQESIERKDKV